jgi:hypothetical protein
MRLGSLLLAMRLPPSMPFKHNAVRRHRIPRTRYRVTNWPVYEAGLRRHGDLTLRLDKAMLAGWAAPKRSSPSGQPVSVRLQIGVGSDPLLNFV